MRPKSPATSVAESPPLTPGQLTVYYWRRGFLLAAPSFVLERTPQPYRRLSITLVFALAEAFTLDAGDSAPIRARAVVLAPKVERRSIRALASDLIICDWSVSTDEYHALMPLLGEAQLRVIDRALLAPLDAEFRHTLDGTLPPGELRPLLHRAIECLTGQPPAPAQLPGPLGEALRLIDETPLRTIRPAWLAARVRLSTSRLRQLFREELGSSLSHYLRWIAMWRVAWLWTRYRPLAELAEEVGIYDLAHLNRMSNEIFGLNPSDLYAKNIRLLRCEQG